MAALGPRTISGQKDAAARNGREFISDGFCRTGDLMRRVWSDGDACDPFACRSGDGIYRANAQANVEEMERAVAMQPAFTDVAVVGMACRTHGDGVCLHAVALDGKTLPEVVEPGAFLKDACLVGSRLPGRPGRFEWIDALPPTKVDKREQAPLRADVAGTVAREAAAEPMVP